MSNEPNHHIETDEPTSVSTPLGRLFNLIKETNPEGYDKFKENICHEFDWHLKYITTYSESIKNIAQDPLRKARSRQYAVDLPESLRELINSAKERATTIEINGRSFEDISFDELYENISNIRQETKNKIKEKFVMTENQEKTSVEELAENLEECLAEGILIPKEGFVSSPQTTVHISFVECTFTDCVFTSSTSEE